MKQSLFVDWLENHFKLSAEQYQTNKISVKVILLVDDIKAHEIQWAWTKMFQNSAAHDNVPCSPMEQRILHNEEVVST